MLHLVQLADVLVPKSWMLSNELFHEFHALNAVNHLDVHAVRPDVVFRPPECPILADDHVGNFVQQNSAAAHVAGG